MTTTQRFVCLRWAAVLFLAGLTAMAAGCRRRPAPPAPVPASEVQPIRILLVGDPFGVAMTRARGELEQALGAAIELEVVGYNDNRRLLLQAAKDEQAAYDLASFDVVWLGELVARQALASLPSGMKPAPSEFLAGSRETCRHEGRLYGLPIQPHSELLWIRRDWFEAEGVAFPRTAEELLAAARHFHRPQEGRYGIAWNAQRGVPLGQTMAHWFAAFGQPLLDARGRPEFGTERGLQAARFAYALKELSPPDILNMAWDQRVSRFASGVVAMTYGWGARAYLAEEDPLSKVRGKVQYGPPPHAADATPVAPLGVWALGIPANAPRPEVSRRALELIVSEPAQRLLVRHGQGAPPLKALLADPALQSRHPVFAAMTAIQETHRLSAEMRPAIPEWSRLCEVLGAVFHDMLRDRLSPEEALAEAERQANALFDAP